jgi:hypothetical protein
MPFTRETYQGGSLSQEPRAKGNVWIYRWRETTPDGKRTQRKIIVGAKKDLRTKAIALKAVDSLNLQINQNQPGRGPITVGELVAHYTAAELGAERSNKTEHTCEVYRDCLKNHIVPRWGATATGAVCAPDVEAWLRSLPLADSSKAKLRNVMSATWNHGIRHRLVDSNPIIGPVKGSGVRQSSKRAINPDVLTGEEIERLLERLRSHFGQSSMCLHLLACDSAS